jgi:transposase
LVLAFVLKGCTRAEAARQCGMDRQTLRDWVIRYNDLGIAGLSDQPHGGGMPPKLSEAEKTRVAEWVRHGPDLAEDGVVRWRLTDLKRRIFERFFVVLDERSVSRLLKSMSFSYVSARPGNPKASPEAQEAHKKTSPAWLLAPFRPKHGTSHSNSGGRTKPGSANRAA